MISEADVLRQALAEHAREAAKLQAHLDKTENDLRRAQAELADARKALQEILGWAQTEGLRGVYQTAYDPETRRKLAEICKEALPKC